jgi:metal-sulfur cluster biosynthetic enzyme
LFLFRYEAALERKSKIIEIIRSLNLPNNPLDDIVDQLGGPEKVAEMTGRRGMLVRASNGKGVTYQARNTKDITMEMVNMHEKQLFMDGKKLVAIISEAGSAGVSLQADRRAVNQKRRVHLTLELPWSADRAIQQFGRTHRSNQTSAPEYRLNDNACV